MSSKNKKTAKKNKKKSSVITKICFKVAMYVIGTLILVTICKEAFEFGALVYTEEGMDEEGAGRDVVITIPADSTTGEIASILKENGLIESEFAFMVQTFLYEADIYSGTYTLNTEYGPEELIEIMSTQDTES